MKKVGIIGYGEIGQSLEKCYLGKEFCVQVLDTGKKIFDLVGKADIINIAIPFKDQESFSDIVCEYINKFSPNLVIIHSTVTPGTTKKVIAKSGFWSIAHSPVRGVHPNLYEGLKTFVKFIGADSLETVEKVKGHYEELGVQYDTFDSSEATELAKVLSTTYYGMCIAFHNDMNELCKEYDVKYEEVASKWNLTYNAGYKSLGMNNVVRPVLYPPKEGKIGGHCIIPNAELCQTFFDSKVLEYILELKE
jgi:UDP-N-acetyl-D-mannosaminuronate dehydrogenase